MMTEYFQSNFDLNLFHLVPKNPKMSRILCQISNEIASLMFQQCYVFYISTECLLTQFYTFFKQAASTAATDSLLPVDADSFQGLYDALNNNSIRFKKALEAMNISELAQSVTFSAKWNNLINLIQRSESRSKIEQVVLFKEMYPQVVEMLSSLEHRIVECDLINDDTKLYESKREELFSALAADMNSVRQANVKLKDVMKSSVCTSELEKACTSALDAKLKHIEEQLVNYSCVSGELTQRQCDEFRVCHQHLSAAYK